MEVVFAKCVGEKAPLLVLDTALIRKLGNLSTFHETVTAVLSLPLLLLTVSPRPCFPCRKKRLKCKPKSFGGRTVSCISWSKSSWSRPFSARRCRIVNFIFSSLSSGMMNGKVRVKTRGTAIDLHSACCSFHRHTPTHKSRTCEESRHPWKFPLWCISSNTFIGKFVYVCPKHSNA